MHITVGICQTTLFKPQRFLQFTALLENICTIFSEVRNFCGGHSPFTKTNSARALPRVVLCIKQLEAMVFVFKVSSWDCNTCICDNVMLQIQLFVLLLSISVLQRVDGNAKLLSSKVILNEYLVEGKGLTILYSIYNIGTR